MPEPAKTIMQIPQPIVENKPINIINIVRYYTAAVYKNLHSSSQFGEHFFNSSIV